MGKKKQKLKVTTVSNDRGEIHLSIQPQIVYVDKEKGKEEVDKLNDIIIKYGNAPNTLLNRMRLKKEVKSLLLNAIRKGYLGLYDGFPNSTLSAPEDNS